MTTQDPKAPHRASGPLAELAAELTEAGFPARLITAEQDDWSEIRAEVEARLGINGWAQVDWARFPRDETMTTASPLQRACQLLSIWGRGAGAGHTVWIVPFFGTEDDAVAIEVSGAALAAVPERIAAQDPLAVLCKETGWCFVWRHENEMRAGVPTQTAQTEETGC